MKTIKKNHLTINDLKKENLLTEMQKRKITGGADLILYITGCKPVFADCKKRCSY